MDGGWWDYVSALIKKYGVVPQEIMPETHSSSNTAQMNGVLRNKLKVEAVRLRQLKREGKSLAELRAEKARMLAEVYRILVINLGEPPAKFSWRFEDKESKLSPTKTYTPQSFWKEWVGEINFDDYVQLANVPGQDYGRLYPDLPFPQYPGNPGRAVSQPEDRRAQGRGPEVGPGQAARLVCGRRGQGPGRCRTA